MKHIEALPAESMLVYGLDGGPFEVSDPEPMVCDDTDLESRRRLGQSLGAVSLIRRTDLTLGEQHDLHLARRGRLRSFINNEIDPKFLPTTG